MTGSEATRSQNSVTPAILASRLIPIIVDVAIEHPRSLLAKLAEMYVDIPYERSLPHFDPELLAFALFPFDWLMGTKIGVPATSTRSCLVNGLGDVLNEMAAKRGFAPLDGMVWRRFAIERMTAYARALTDAPEDIRRFDFGRLVIAALLRRQDPLAEVAVVNWFDDMVEYYDAAISLQVIVEK
jgi:hypothetical protein